MDVRSEVRRLAEPLAEEAGCELVDVELVVQGRQRVVRVLLDKPGGITLGDCSAFSRRLGDGLDMNQTVPGSYRLEVSSPGMDRPVTSLEAVARFAGRRAMLTTTLPREGRRHYEGELLEPRDGACGIRTEDGAEHRFEWPEVKSIRLVVDPWERSRRTGAPGGNAARGTDRGARPGGASRRSRGGSR
ncbi:MAG TPA: ribosome maturation factor RimP [Terriglobales bacterium]|nr:ribosome maturation factor RimP [Terriglobales bacterium]